MAPLQQAISTVPGTAADVVLQGHCQRYESKGTWADHAIAHPDPPKPPPTLISMSNEAEHSQTLDTIYDGPSPDGGVALPPSETILGNSGHPRRNLASGTQTPSRRANVRTRRSHHGPLLSQSPARAGHTSRMHQIFENAARGCTTTCADVGGVAVLYPQLPNISRKASPGKHERTQHAPSSFKDESGLRADSPCRSTGSSLNDPQADLRVLQCVPVSERTSGSWSDDSGYIIADACRKTGIAVSPSRRVRDWLSSVYEAVDLTDTIEGTKGRHIRHIATAQPKVGSSIKDRVPVGKPASPSLSAALNYSRTEPTASFLLAATADDAFISDHQIHINPTPQSYKPSHTTLRNTPIPHRLKEYIPEICERLDFDTATTRAKTHPPTTQTPCTTPTHVNQNHTIHIISTYPPTQDADIVQLSPLSPNVCLERGPARHHTSPGSPTLNRASASRGATRRFFPRSTRFKEDVGSPLALGAACDADMEIALAAVKAGVDLGVGDEDHGWGGNGVVS